MVEGRVGGEEGVGEGMVGRRKSWVEEKLGKGWDGKGKVGRGSVGGNKG